MNDVGFGDLVLRMLLSLVIVLAVVLGAYAFLRRRQGLGGSVRRTSLVPINGSGSRTAAIRTAIFGSRSGKPNGTRRGLRVVGRVGIGRTTQVVAVQFAEKVYLLGASEQSAPSILAELELAAWQAATEPPPDDSGSGPMTTVRDRGSARLAGGDATATDAPDRRPGLLQALRDATVRRG
ncbi:MAG: flagellar biosynthetic protein FliO [Ilumatobacteraceae bacterium]|jgi:flagellar biogenesis protein FliO